MKHSIQKRLAFVFILLFVLALTAIGLINAFFIPRAYRSQKEKALVKSWTMMNASGKADDDFSKYCSVNALTFAVADSNLQFLYTNSEDGEGLVSRIFGNVSNKEQKNSKVLKQEDQYQIIQIHDRFKDMDYLEIWGTLDNSNYYIALSPLQSIDEAASLSTRFLIFVGVIVACIGVIVIVILSGKLVKPVRELTELSKRMANLDFGVRYESGGKDEIGVLGENFNIMSEKLEEAVSQLKSANSKLKKDIAQKQQIDDVRKEFLSNVSHELKTPIALIQGYAEGLKDNVNEDEESRNFYCDVIIDESEKMNKMVKKLLTLNQLEFGNDQITMERFDLAELIRSVIHYNKISIDQKGAEVVLDMEDSVPVWGDEFKIEEVVTNYLSNALNHLSGDPKIIRVTCREENGIVTASVFNTGEQIPEEDLEKVWIKFFKVDKARTRAYGGSGIGLSIVKAIMDSHGQKCWVENRPDGVEFFFTLESKTV